MHGSTFGPVVSLIVLLVHGTLAFFPISEEVSRLGHQVFWVVEIGWFLWENKREIAKLRAACGRSWRV